MSALRVVVLIVLLLAPVIAAAQAPPPSGVARPVRTIIASGRLASVVTAPMHFKLVRVTVPAGQSITYTGANGMLYVASGSLEVGLEGQRRPLGEGAALFTPGPERTVLTAAAGAPAVALHFLLVPASELDRAVHSAPASATELFRGSEPLPNLKPGLHEFTMIRVSVDKGAPRPPMHHRSGAALYYVLAGTWTIHLEGKSESRTRGNIQPEPNGFVHTWENTGDTTGVLLQANISPEGSPEIIFLPQR